MNKNAITSNDMLNQILTETENSNKVIILICGVPGSGKSTLSNQLSNKLISSFVLSLDGYHKYFKDLTEEQKYYRGRIDTFDLELFQKDFISLINNQLFSFPTFEHSLKDPSPNTLLYKNQKYIIVEGLYTHSSYLSEIFPYINYKLFIVSDLDKAMTRVAIRNFNAGLTLTYEDSVKRAEESDKKNGLFVLENSVFDEKTYYLRDYEEN